MPPQISNFWGWSQIKSFIKFAQLYVRLGNPKKVSGPQTNIDLYSELL